MTKIKNTKKGMAKKTLSMSLVVAMLATSNVPVWAAEFSDGTDAAVETEAPVADIATEAFTDDAAPVVDNEENAVVATAASDYDFSGITVNNKAKNATWAGKTADFSSITSANVFGNSKIKKDGIDYTGTGLEYAWAYNGAWDKSTLTGLNSATVANVSLPNTNVLKNHVNEAWSLIIVESGSTTPIANVSLGTIQPVNVADTGVRIADLAEQTYDGTEKKPQVAISGTAGSAYNSELETVGNYSWSYAGSNGLINAGSTVTITGTYTGADANCYTGTLIKTFKIEKYDLSSSNAAKIVIKAATPDKEFTYAGKNNLQVDNSEVNVYLADANDSTYTTASDILLNDFVKKVTVDASSVKNDAKFTVTFDAAKINASSNFKVADKTDFSKISSEKYDEKTNTVKITALDLASVTVTLKNPLKINNVTPGSYPNVSNLVFTKDGKELNLSNDVTASIANGEYKQPGTYTGAITVSANSANVKGSTVANLVVKTNVFGPGAGFKATTAGDYLSTTKAGVASLSKGLDYNNGNAVEFKTSDLFTEKSGALLGWFDPTGNNSQSATDQSYFRVKYSDNVNATGEKVGVLTVYAVGGDYEGCSKDFYFKINPSTVNPTNTSSTTVTTAITKDIAGVSIKEANDKDAAAYADTIGLVVKGTNDPTLTKEVKDRITSNATTNDYKVEYSFVKADRSTAGSNKVGDYVAAKITLKKNGNFALPENATSTSASTTVSNLPQLGKENTGVRYAVTAAGAKDNGVITLYVPIVEKSISDLDISLDQTSYTFTGTTIEPKVSVKLNGKAFVKDTDYTVSVKNGINVGTADVVVTLKESTGYKGSKTLSATITPAKISDVKFVIKDGHDQVYDTKQKKPTIAQVDDPATTKDEAVEESVATAQVKLGSVVISQLFDVTYGTNIDAGKDAGTVTLTPKAAAAKNFDGSSTTATFDIKRQTLTNNNKGWAIKLVNDDGVIISKNGNNALSANDTDMEWTGKDTVFANSSLVSANIDATDSTIRRNDYTYELAYANNVEKTTSSAPAFVCVVGTGNYGGTYSIVKAKNNGSVSAMPTEDVEAANKKNPGTYEVLLDNVVKDSWATFQIAGRSFAAKNVTITNATYAGGVAVKPGSVVKDPKTGAVLTEGKDYELVFDTKNVDATTTPIEVSVKGIGQYKGSLVNSKVDGSKLTFTIDKKDLKDCSVSVDKNLKLTVMNGNVVEEKENFDVKDNGDGTATVSVVDGGKNYTGSVNVEIGGRKVGAPMISNVKVVGNKATVILSDEVEGASGYDYVISTDKDCITNKDYTAVNKNQAKTSTAFKYVDKGTYYAYCHAWTRDANGKKVFGEWSNGFQFSVTATTPDAPVITSVKVSGSTIKVTYKEAANATGYDVVLGTSSKKDNGELRPYNYGAHKKLNIKEGTVTATFKNVPAGTWTVGMHAFNRTSIDGKKVFSPWSNLKTAKVK